MPLYKDEVGRVSHLMIGTLRRMGAISSGVVGQSTFLKDLLSKNCIAVETDFMSEGVPKSGLKPVKALLAYNPSHQKLCEMGQMFSDFMVIACWNTDFGYEEWRKSLYDIGTPTDIHRGKHYQVILVTK